MPRQLSMPDQGFESSNLQAKILKYISSILLNYLKVVGLGFDNASHVNLALNHVEPML
jgi:hypothetical protein